MAAMLRAQGARREHSDRPSDDLRRRQSAAQTNARLLARATTLSMASEARHAQAPRAPGASAPIAGATTSEGVNRQRKQRRGYRLAQHRPHGKLRLRRAQLNPTHFKHSKRSLRCSGRKAPRARGAAISSSGNCRTASFSPLVSVKTNAASRCLSNRRPERPPSAAAHRLRTWR